MSAYFISKFNIVDDAKFDQYVEAVLPLIDKHQGKVLVGNKHAQSIEGPLPGMNVLIEFPSEEAALEFYNDPEYQPVKAIRFGSTTDQNAVLSPRFVYDEA